MRTFLKRHATAVVLSVLALAAMLYVFLYDRKTISTAEHEARKKNLFGAWRKDDLSKVVVKSPSGNVELVRSKKTSDGAQAWDVTIDGVTYTGEDQAVDKYLETLEYASFTREIPSANVDRSGFGLDDPRTKVDVSMGDLSFHLVIGKPAPTKNEAYAEVVGRGVFAVSMPLVLALEVDPEDLRSKAFVPYLSTELTEIDLAGDGGERAFVRGGWSGGRGSGFRVKSPTGDGVRVDGNALDRVLVAFGRMQASAFLDDATADKASSPKVTVTLVPREGAKAVLAIGGACPTKKDQVIAVRREPTRLNVCVPSEVLAPLAQNGSAFEDRGLIGASADEVTEVRIVEKKDGAEKKLDIARAGSGFKMRAPSDRSIGGERGNAFLRALLDAKGDVLPTDAPTPEGTPVEVRIVSQGGLGPTGETKERVEELDVYPAKDDQSIVVRKEDGRKLKVSAAVAKSFAVSDLLVRDLDVLKHKPDEVEAVSIDAPGKKQRFKRDAGALVLVEPKGKGLTLDIGFASSLLEKLASLKASRWVADTDDGSFGLSTPRFTIGMELAAPVGGDAGGPHEETLVIGARADDGSYAKLASDPAVFLVPPDIEEQASRWLVSRTDFITPVASIDKLELHAEGKALALSREGSALRVVGGKDKRALDAAADVQQSFDDLVPIAAVTIGAAADYQGFKKPTLAIDCVAGKSTVHYDVGAGDTYEGTSIFYVRRADVDATFVVPQAAIRPLLKSVDAAGP